MVTTPVTTVTTLVTMVTTPVSMVTTLVTMVTTVPTKRMRRRITLSETHQHSKSLDDVQLSAYQRTRVKMPWILKKVP
jgi:hypothetical protein